ncbi:MAG TPA: DUF4433 domain-containing protein [Vicinamibacterales bacterium]|nr:DUF4433 domain-containing protein [Vicinamibacterales bacterium]
MKELTPEKALVFRIAHIGNVPWMLANGLHCRKSHVCDPNFIEIGNPDLISKRAHRVVPIAPGGTLADYVPFYFTPFTPMLLNIKTGYNGMKQTAMRDIVILVSSLHRLQELGLQFVFTDRHAYLAAAVFADNLADLVNIDWKILQARDFKRDPNDPGKMERYQAEALVYQQAQLDVLLGLVCHGPEQEAHLNELVQAANVNLKVIARRGWYV